MEPRDNINEELKNLAPGLSKLKKVNPFEVPEYYFERLPKEVKSKISQESPQTIWEWIKKYILQPQYAAITAILIIGIIWFTNIKNENPVEKQLAKVSSDEALAYLDENIEEVDEEIITEIPDNIITGDSAVKTKTVTTEDINKQIDELDIKDIEDYLTDELYNPTYEEELL